MICHWGSTSARCLSRRLLTDEEITHFAADPRFVFLKDVSCNLETVKRRLELTKIQELVVSNANAAIAFDAMKSGASGFCGVFNNFHPDLYRWLQDEGVIHTEFADELSAFFSSCRGYRGDGIPEVGEVISSPSGYDSISILEGSIR